MAYKNINLFKIGARGVNTVNTPTHLTEDELSSAQNAEHSPTGGRGGIDQRPGMSRINLSALGGGNSVIMVHDVPSQRLADLTPTLVASYYSGGTHNWRQTTDGTTWSDNDSAVKCWSSNNTNIVMPGKMWPKITTIGRYTYWFDLSNPIQLHRWDGVNDLIISSIPPAVTGTTLGTPCASHEAILV